MRRAILFSALLLTLIAAGMWAQAPAQPDAEPGAGVTFARLLNAVAEPQNWLTYSGTMRSQRHTALDQIKPSNVAGLKQQWIFQARSLEKFEATPLVVDGIMYTVQAPNDVVALDAATGRIFWIYSYRPSQDARPCCGRVNRGLAILGNTLYMGTIDAHLIAVDARTGTLLWDRQLADPAAGYAITHAPLIVKDKVLVGTAGGEFGIRGFISAFNASTGDEAWRFYVVPGPGEPGFESWGDPEQEAWKIGGGSVWVTGSYDPELDLTYWGTGNPGPDWNGDTRPGDNLYTDSVVALNPDTGERQWHYQFSPHDEFDFDAVQVPVLADIGWPNPLGEPVTRKVIMWANRNGLFYVIDRTNGQFLLGRPFVEVNWMSGFDEAGRPIRVPGKVPTPEGTLIQPGNQGGTNWYSPSFSPATGLFYIPSWVSYSSIYVKQPVEYVEGRVYAGAMPTSPVPMIRAPQINQLTEEEGYGAVRAIDPRTGDLVWEYKMSSVTDAGILTTASNLLFSGGREGYFYALNSSSGEMLWRVSLGGQLSNGPISYAVDGRQYIAVTSGNNLFAFALE